MDGAEKQLFAVRLVPHRSLSHAHFRVLLIVFAGACVFTALPFALLGAWPVAGFMGFDILLFYWAFRSSYRSARAYEDVTVTPIELHVSKVSPVGDRTDWSFNPSWVRIEREEHEDYGTCSVAVASRGRRLEVGSFLGPDAKASFADGLARALAEARRGPRFS